jgi:pimeloyl-ACP methyl ester carboxylesterase
LIRALRTPAQLAKSWYMFCFQIPVLPEAVMSLDNYKILLRSLRDEPNDLARYVEAYKRPGALTAMVNWYRGMFRSNAAVKLAKISAPVLVLWGKDDPYLGVELATPPSDLVPDAHTIILPDATHWVQADEPARVNQELVAFFRLARSVVNGKTTTTSP